jgi:hypothetical protein
MAILRASSLPMILILAALGVVIASMLLEPTPVSHKTELPVTLPISPS